MASCASGPQIRKSSDRGGLEVQRRSIVSRSQTQLGLGELSIRADSGVGDLPGKLRLFKDVETANLFENEQRLDGSGSESIVKSDSSVVRSGSRIEKK